MPGDRPFIGLGLHVIQSGGKIGLPKHLADYVPWCTPNEEHSCLARSNGRGGITIFSPKILQQRQALMSRANKDDLRLEEVETSRVEAFRALAESWQVTVTKAGVMTLPMDARLMGLLPKEEGDHVAVVALCGAFELWHPEMLREEMQVAAKELGELMVRAGFEQAPR